MLGVINSESGIYKVMLVLHLLTVIVGLGAVMLNGVYGIQAKNNPGPGGVAILKANHKVSDIAEKIIYLIPIFGFALVGMSNKQWEFSQLWVWLSLVLYVAALGIAHGVLKPGQKKLIALGEEIIASGPPQGGPPPQLAQMQAIGKRMGTFGPINGILAVVLVALMVFKPGA